MQNRFISYIRVSDQKQEKSGLGLSAQRQTITDYLASHGGELIEEVQEVQSGGRDNRPELKRALDMCRKHGAVLLLPKLDRLSRRVSFVSRLMESNIKFVVADMPQASNFMLHIYSAVAEEEKRMIGERTKRALAAAKARGTKLGTYGATLAKYNQNAALTFSVSLRDIINDIRASGYRTTRAVCDELNRRGIGTFRGVGHWHLPATHKLLKRIDALAV